MDKKRKLVEDEMSWWWPFANKKSKNDDDLINKELDDLKRRRNLCEDDLRLLQRKLNSLQDELSSLQDELLNFQLAGDEIKTRILERAVAKKEEQITEKKSEIAEKKGEIAEKNGEIAEKEAVLAKTPQEKDEWKQRALAARQAKNGVSIAQRGLTIAQEAQQSVAKESLGVDNSPKFKLEEFSLERAQQSGSLAFFNNFIETPQSNRLKEILNDNLKNVDTHAGEPTRFCCPVVTGSMGSGKTFTSQQVIRSITTREFMRVYVDLSTMLGLLNVDLDIVLGSILLSSFTGKFRKISLMNLVPYLKQEFKKDFKDILLLHVDEFQFNQELCQKIIIACKITVQTPERSGGLRIFPIFSGVTNYVHVNPDVAVENMVLSQWRIEPIKLTALPIDKLHDQVKNKLELPPDYNLVEDCKNLVLLMQDCGYFARFVVKMVEACCLDGSIKKRIQEKGFEEEHAKPIYDIVLGDARQHYGENRWHSLILGFKGIRTNENARTSGNWYKTAFLMRRMVLFVLAGTPVTDTFVIKYESDVLLRYTELQKSGIVDLQPMGSGLYVMKLPLIVLQIMNAIAKSGEQDSVLPLVADLSNPFMDNWQTLERVALASHLVHVLVEPVTPIERVRPGTWLFFGNDHLEHLQIRCPSRTDFLMLKSHLFQLDEILLGVENSIEEFEEGDVVLTAPNEPKVDGLSFLVSMVGSQLRPCLVLFQVKKQELSPQTGAPSGSTLHNKTAVLYIDDLRKIATELRQRKPVQTFLAKFPNVEPILIYDVFSDRNPPKRSIQYDEFRKLFELKENEVVFITRSDDLENALGGLAARKREVLDRD